MNEWAYGWSVQVSFSLSTCSRFIIAENNIRQCNFPFYANMKIDFWSMHAMDYYYVTNNSNSNNDNSPLLLFLLFPLPYRNYSGLSRLSLFRSYLIWVFAHVHCAAYTCVVHISVCCSFLAIWFRALFFTYISRTSARKCKAFCVVVVVFVVVVIAAIAAVAVMVFGWWRQRARSHWTYLYHITWCCCHCCCSSLHSFMHSNIVLPLSVPPPKLVLRNLLYYTLYITSHHITSHRIARQGNVAIRVCLCVWVPE